MSPQTSNITHYGFDNFNEHGVELSPLDGTSTSNKRWLADHLYEEVRAEEKAAPIVRSKKKLTEKEKDELFEKMVGAWRDDPTR